MNSVDPSSLINSTAAAAAAAAPGAGRARRKNESETQLRLGRSYEKMIQQAIGSDASDPAAVDHARDALNAQELDTLEAARQAALKMAKYGI